MKSIPRHILELSKEEQRKFIDSFDTLLSDCDGVLWMLVGPISGSGEAINLLKKANKSVKFVSNNSFRSDENYMKRFKQIGAIDINDIDLVHPVKTIVRYLQKHKPGKRVFSLMSQEANETLRKNGIDFESLNIKEHLTAGSLADIIAIDKPVSAVLCDIHLDLSYVELAKAIQYLQHSEECELLVGASDIIMPLAQNLHVPGFYDFVQFIRRYINREPILLGKPSPILGDFLKELYDIRKPERCIFVGDMLEQDIKFGKSCGFQTLHVLSGSQTKEDMLSAPTETQPDYYADSLADFIELFRNIGV